MYAMSKVGTYARSGKLIPGRLAIGRQRFSGRERKSASQRPIKQPCTIWAQSYISGTQWNVGSVIWPLWWNSPRFSLFFPLSLSLFFVLLFLPEKQFVFFFTSRFNFKGRNKWKCLRCWKVYKSGDSCTLPSLQKKGSKSLQKYNNL